MTSEPDPELPMFHEKLQLPLLPVAVPVGVPFTDQATAVASVLVETVKGTLLEP